MGLSTTKGPGRGLILGAATALVCLLALAAPAPAVAQGSLATEDAETPIVLVIVSNDEDMPVTNIAEILAGAATAPDDGLLDVWAPRSVFGFATLDKKSAVAVTLGGEWSYGDETGSNYGLRNTNPSAEGYMVVPLPANDYPTGLRSLAVSNATAAATAVADAGSTDRPVSFYF